MPADLEERLGAALSRAVGVVRRHVAATLTIALALTILTGGVAATRLGINADTDALFDADLPFRRLRTELDEAFPAQRDAILAVIDGPTALAAESAAADLAARVEAEPQQFHGAFAPGAGPFFERHGLLYLSVEDLDRLGDELVRAQPFLAALTRDPSLRGVFDQLTLAIRHREALGGASLGEALEGVHEALEGAVRLEPRPRAFGALLPARQPGDTRRFVLVTPVVDFGAINAGYDSLERLRTLARELGFAGRGVRMRLTGDLALQAEELEGVRGQAALAGLGSFLAVAAILGFALRSVRLVVATLVTLLVGLVWTAGFAGLAVGHLNVISVAFAVLFIGLGVDFGIHFCLRYREMRAGGADTPRALGETAHLVGSSLALCALTTAIGFFAFVPTGYRGVAELGVISGVGMLISLLATLTVLPALLALGGGAPAPRSTPTQDLRLPGFPVRFPRSVCTVALVVAIGSSLLVPRLRFDPNPLRVRDPGSEAVRTFEELLEGGRINPWSIDVIEPDLAAADALAARLDGLPTVERAVTLSDQVPDHQEVKLERIDDIAFLLGLDALATRPPPTRAEIVDSVEAFSAAVRKLASGSGALAVAARQLRPSLDALPVTLREEGERPEAVLAVLDASLVEPVVERVERLRTALRTGPVGPADLPEPLREEYLAADGRARVQVFPTESLRDDAALARFVRAVRAVAPDATGTSVYLFDAERVVLSSLGEAFGLSLICVALLLGLLWRSARDAALALAPLLLAALVTGAVTVLIGLPINFADVIVLPLLLGIGVDSGIHLVHRHRVGEESGLLETSTSRAVLWSALTTIASFGSLGFSPHRGMASLGQLLTLGMATMLLANLLFLPALLALVDGAQRRRVAGPPAPPDA